MRQELGARAARRPNPTAWWWQAGQKSLRGVKGILLARLGQCSRIISSLTAALQHQPRYCCGGHPPGRTAALPPSPVHTQGRPISLHPGAGLLVRVPGASPKQTAMWTPRRYAVGWQPGAMMM